MNPQTIVLVIKLLDLLIAGVAVSTAGVAKVRALVAEGRDPTPEETAALLAQIEDARRRLHSDGPDGTVGGVAV